MAAINRSGGYPGFPGPHRLPMRPLFLSIVPIPPDPAGVFVAGRD